MSLSAHSFRDTRHDEARCSNLDCAAFPDHFCSMSSGGAPGFCIIHAADLHLGARRFTQGMPKNLGLREKLFHADRLAFSALLDLCISERARFLLCSGDVIDGWCRDASAGLFLATELLRLREVGCETLILLGNHDIRSRAMRSLLLPCQASLIGVYGPETRNNEQLGFSVHGWSLPSVAPGDDVVSHYPEPISGHLNVGLLHTSAEGCRGHIDYAPCSRLSLRRKGYDYWALGHVHTREVVATDPFIVFPGNLQGRGFREPGGKGATRVEVQNGNVVSVEHRAINAVQFENLIVDDPSISSFEHIVEAVRLAGMRAALRAGRCPLVVRVVVSGVESSAALLRVPSKRRRVALEWALGDLPQESVFLDEIWMEPGSFSGPIRLDVAA